MGRKTFHYILRFLIGAVWFANGLFCKVLGWVPRHEQIVAKILGEDYASEITQAIGMGEVFLAIWVWSGFYSRFNALLQIALVAVMNVLEFFRSPELLLWERYNALYAGMFIVTVCFSEWGFGKNQQTNHQNGISQ